MCTETPESKETVKIYSRRQNYQTIFCQMSINRYVVLEIRGGGSDMIESVQPEKRRHSKKPGR